MALRVTWPLWIFNGLMLWGAILGFIIGLSAVNLQDAVRHHGPGTVYYGEDGEWSKEVSESQYKRHEYTTNGMMLALGLWLWIVVAKYAKKDTSELNT